MTIPVTADTVKAVYTCLLSFPPFCRWNLPTDLTFEVVPYTSEWGSYHPEKKLLRISTAKVSTFQSLVIAVGHEMVHVREDVAGRWAKKHDNAYFKKLADQVCKAFELDRANF